MTSDGEDETQAQAQGDVPFQTSKDDAENTGAPEDASNLEDAGTVGEEARNDDGESQPEGPVIRVQVDAVSGDFRIRGGAEYVLLNTDDDERYGGEPRVHGGEVRFGRLPSGSELAVPDGAEVVVGRVNGDLEATNLDGLIAVDQVDGDVEVNGVALLDLARISGDFRATGGDSLRVRAVSGDLDLSDFAGEVTVGHVGGDLEASNLRQIEAREAIGGDATFIRCDGVTLRAVVGGDLKVERSVIDARVSSVGGDVQLSDAQGVQIGSVGGDLRIESASQAVEAQTVGGDARLRDIAGMARLGTVGGDLTIEDALGGVVARRTGGDATLNTPLAAGAEYSVHAAGDISLRVRGEVNAGFVAQTAAGEVRTRLPLTVERGRRRNLVGVIGRGEATVTLRSDGGDISITAADRYETGRYQEEQIMSDDFVGRDPDGQNEEDARSWEGGLGRHRFRVRLDRGPGHARVHFRGPYTQDDDPDGMGTGAGRDFGFEWEKGRGGRAYGEYGERLNVLRDRAERVARQATEEASRYADEAKRRAKETDWEGVGREVRSAIEKAMADLEDSFTQVRRDWETRKPGSKNTPPSAGNTSTGGAQRVRIEYDDGDSFAGAGAAAAAEAGATSSDDVESQRRAVLEELRAGTISLDEAERRLNALR